MSSYEARADSRRAGKDRPCHCRWGQNRSNQHVYFYHRVRFDRGTGVYQGAHHRATSGESREVDTETTKETSFRCSPLSCARDAPRVWGSIPGFRFERQVIAAEERQPLPRDSGATAECLALETLLALTSFSGCMILRGCVQPAVMPLDQGCSECPAHGKSFAQHFGNCTNDRFR